MCFSVGRGWYSSICCALFRGVFDASVVAVEDQLCVRGFGCHLFAKLFLGHGVFICVSMMSSDLEVFFFFCEDSLSNGFSDNDLLCYSDTTLWV